ncbi:Ca2+-dependent phosphoinositide-specific phospholipase C [Alteromonas gilva]|uniref:Ca2+-dependent phosphoinositide-specific phospholipase C n=1 Tax=Alteromonas gilva TaxID=2987522 RepID=A0ABT5L180_9ALTE|nr:Ca2+-dependent phosphoinositide-specific phospholipase C [Alteromonas gilva]MDC8830808.1 Ca2+-dependent phosphoinositide-specific phospholipase C [Alteromonas gilva]
MRLLRFITVLLIPLTSVAANLDQYQIIGSHNSYKRALPPELLQYLQTHHSDMAKQLNYSHPTLSEQLASGLRQLEIDVVNDPDGQQYDKPHMEAQLNAKWLTDAERAALAAPGFKVLHIPHVDVLSHCIDFGECLSRLSRWSDAHPAHFPILIMLNAKESQPDFVTALPPQPFSGHSYDALDTVIREVMQGKLVTPDDIRGEHHTLNEAVRQTGWPAIDTLRGKFIFLFDANPQQRRLYARHHPSLQGRAMFASFTPDSDEAAIMIRNDPLSQQSEIRELVLSGFLVRTRADADLSATPTQMNQRMQAAFNSGAQFISTDFHPQSPQAKQTGHQVVFADGHLVRQKNASY